MNGTSNNPMSQTNQNPLQVSSYDAASDGVHQHLYDGERRRCAVGILRSSSGTQYIYDAEGARVAKGYITSWSCDTAVNGFTPTNSYVLGPSNEQLTETEGNGNWTHTNVYAAGMLIATYDSAPTGDPALHFQLEDWLDTRRVAPVPVTIPNHDEGAPGPSLLGTGDIDTMQAITSTRVPDTSMTLPLACLLSAASGVPPHSTGKERDTESGNDYFGARYYASSMGRFLSPDWSAKIMPVPYAKLGNPQSLNLYSYVWNNPLSRNDPDGHYTCADGSKCDSANDKAFQSRLDNLKAAQGTFKEGSKECKQIGKILSAYGGAGDTNTANGKTVSVGFSGGANTGGVTRSIDKGTIGVSLASNFSEQSSGNNVGTTVLVGHEGQHVADGAPSGTARFGSEMRAESVSQTILQGLSGTSVMPSNMDSFSIRGITTWQRGGDSELGGAPYNPGAAFRIGVEDYKQDVQNDPK